MNSIRPLITITILVVAFAFLYVKINESPMQPAVSESGDWDQPSDGVPPLSATAGTSAEATTTAPPWPTNETPAPAAPLVDDGTNEAADATSAAPTDPLPGVTEVTETKPLAVPAVPEMPEPPATTPPPAAATTSIPVTAELPANVPTARYPDQPVATETESPVDVAANVAQSTSTTAETPPTTSPITPESVNAVIAAAPGPASTPLASQPNPLRQAAQPASIVDPLVPADSTAAQGSVAAAAPIEPSFVESWPTIQAALERGELARAHQLLSRWYDDPSLTPIDAERVESLLSQLAGTVVYSTDHQLAPAHVVKPGETLETISQQYNVPWQLLAKINGVAAPDQVKPGQQLKVVPGPFSATVDLTRNQMTLTVDGRYAGKFAITAAPGVEIPANEWYVQAKPPAASPANLPGILLASTENASARLTVIGAEASGQVAQANSPCLTVSPADAAELTDILSIGSRVVIRR
jgi:LysM repeat protein